MVDRGDHHLKFGGYLFRLEFNPVNPNNARGTFTFNGQWTGNAFADFLLGYPSSSQVGIGRADEHGRSTWFHVYGQDDWKIKSNLTLELRAALRDQQPDDRRRQPVVGNRSARPSDSSSRATTKGNLSPTRSAAAVADPDSVRRRRRTPGGRGDCCGPAICASRRAWASSGRSATTARQSSTRVSVSSSISGPTACSRRSPRRCRSSLRRRSRAAADALQPTQTTSTVLLRRGKRHRRRQHDELRLPDRVREELLGLRPASAHVDDDVRGELPSVRRLSAPTAPPC